MSALTPQQRNLVKRSFTHIAPEHAAVSRLFYDKLFEIAPDTRPMFKHDMADQREKVMQMLAAIIAAMDDEAHFAHSVRDLGKRHTDYGVLNEQYAQVGTALVWALREACPAIMTEPVAAAWSAAYNLIAETAISGAPK